MMCFSLCLQLPQKTDRIVFCAPTDSQMTVYRRALDTPVMHLLRTKDERCTFLSVTVCSPFFGLDPLLVLCSFLYSLDIF